VPKATTSAPSRLSAAARAATASVELSFMRRTRSATFIGGAVYGAAATGRGPARRAGGAPVPAYTSPMHYDAHQPVLNDLEARITTIRDSL
jgi:hypothetical protein